MRRLSALAVVGWASLALADVPAPRPQLQCSADSECALTTFSGCCPGCCPQKHAMPVRELAVEQSRCARSKMACPLKKCAMCRAEEDEPTVARCVSGMCVALREPQRPVPSVPVDASGACSSDSECLITSFGGCCNGNCCPTPHAESRRQLEQEQQRCRAMDCARHSCEGQTCKLTLPESAFTAVCRAGACTAERRATTPPPGSECTSSADCTVRYAGPGPDAACQRSPCGCCPGGEPMAVPARSAVPLTRPPPGPAPRPNAPPFGLSDGKGNGPTPPSCSPCPGPRPASATCLGGRCVLANERPRILE